VRVHVVTLFPEMFGAALATGPLKWARERGLLDVALHQIRDYATDRHRQVDDTPYGGGQGMVMKPDPLVAAIEHAAVVDRPRRILLAPQGASFTQARAEALAREPSLLLVCGRYEGVDARVRAFVDDELSIGDYVLSGGEPAALCLIDAVARLLPEVVGSFDSVESDSFHSGLLDATYYTRPAEYRGWTVPEVLLSGNHAEIARHRRREQLRRTLERRPDLLESAALSSDDRRILRELESGAAPATPGRGRARGRRA